MKDAAADAWWRGRDAADDLRWWLAYRFWGVGCWIVNWHDYRPPDTWFKNRRACRCCGKWEDA